MNTLKRRFIGGKRVIVNIKKMEHLNGKEGRVKAKNKRKIKSPLV